MRPVGRRFAAFVAFVALASGLAACGDEDEAVRTIAILRALPASANEALFVPALAELGFPADRLEVLGEDEAYADPDEATAAVRAWIDEGAELIVALSTTSVNAAAEATSTVPILFFVNDPKLAGLVEDERRPEGNLTGVSYRVPADRTLSLAEDAFGEVDRVGCLYQDGDPGAGPVRQELERGAGVLGMAVHCESFAGPSGLDAAVDAVLAADVDVLVPLNSPTMVGLFPELRQALDGRGVPVVTSTPWDHATITLEPDGRTIYRQLAGQVARVLEGDAIADIPVEDPGGFLTVVNLRSARELGIEVPASVVERADEVVR